MKIKTLTFQYDKVERKKWTEDLTGKRFNYFTVISFLGSSKKKGNMWLCKCVCGGIIELPAGYLREPKMKHCGCKYINPATIHNMTNTRPYRIWSAIKSRCTNPNFPSYTDYGGRGISICKRWLSFSNFWEDMKDGYDDKLSIDRINNNKGYYKKNCKWSTRSEQSRNKRNNYWFEVNGVKKCKMDWAEYLGIGHQVINDKLRRGYTFQQVYDHYSKKLPKASRIKKSLCL